MLTVADLRVGKYRIIDESSPKSRNVLEISRIQFFGNRAETKWRWIENVEPRFVTESWRDGTWPLTRSLPRWQRIDEPPVIEEDGI